MAEAFQAPTPPQPSAQIVLITGMMAAGKSSVAQALAERFSPSVHLRGDSFRRMIIQGRAALDSELSAEAERQLRLRYTIAAAAAKLYLAAGFTVVYQDIILGPMLADVINLYHGLPLAVVVLCPSLATVAAREAERAKTAYPDQASIAFFDHVLRNETPRLGYWLDSSELSIAATADAILAHLPAAAIDFTSQTA